MVSVILYILNFSADYYAILAQSPLNFCVYALCTTVKFNGGTTHMSEMSHKRTHVHKNQNTFDS